MNATERVQQARTVYQVAGQIEPMLETLRSNIRMAEELKETLAIFNQRAKELAGGQQEWMQIWRNGGEYAQVVARGLRNAAWAATWRLCAVAVLCGVLSALAVLGTQRWYAGQAEATRTRLEWGSYVEERWQTMTPAERDDFNRLMKLEVATRLQVRKNQPRTKQELPKTEPK